MDAIRHLVIRGLNHLVSSEHWAQEKLRSQAGAQVLVDGGMFRLGLGIDETGLFHASAGNSPDVTLTVPADAAFRLLFDRDRLFTSVRLEGSVDTAETLGFVFRNLQWDVEADLAAVIGDIAAHRLTRFGRSLASSLQAAVRKTAENVAEYAVEDSAFLPAQRDVSEFGSAVSQLRDDVARLEKRLSHL